MSVVHWVKSHIGSSRATGPAVRLAWFTSEVAPITSDCVREDGGWRIETGGKRSFRLFEIPTPGVGRCVLTYRALIRSSNVRTRAYLDLWCRFAGVGEFKSRNTHEPVRGSRDWAIYETSYVVRGGHCPDKIKLNFTFEGPGTVWIKDVELLATALI